LGPISDVSLLRAVRDGRGRQFQRLEFLGDSVLDVVLAVHRWVEPQCEACARDGRHAEASDRYLAEAAQRARVGSWLEWHASHDRIADLVETCVAVCWLSDSWVRVVGFTSTVVHPMGRRTAAALAEGGVAGEPGRAARRVGSAVLELASGRQAFMTLPDADEGVLSTARAAVHEAHQVARRAIELSEVDGAPFGRGDDDMMLSQVEDLLATTLATSGADAALVLAERFVSASH
jgi:hypothetical protein